MSLQRRSGYCVIAALRAVLLCLSGTAQAALIVEIDGVQGDLRDNVLTLLSAQRERATPGLSAAQVQRLFRRGEAEIRTALEPFGHYAVRVDGDVQRVADDWRLHYVVHPGEPVRFTSVDVRLTGAGAQKGGLRRLIADTGMRRGEPARHARYENYKKRLQQAAVALGYLDAAYRLHELRIDASRQSATVRLHLDTGPRYRFGPVSFNQDAGLRDDLLRRFLTFERGAPYAEAKLLELQRALEDSGYFAHVDVAPRDARPADREVPVEITLTPRLRHLYTAGLGFGTDTGVRGLLGWEHRRINRRGHRMRTELRASQIIQSLAMNYSIPLADPRTDRLEITAALLDEHSDTVDTRLQKIGVGRTRMRGTWREALTLNYQREHFQLGLTDETTGLLIPGASYAHIRSDDRLVTRSGHRVQFDLRGAAEPLLSDTNFVQLGVETKLVLALGKRVRLLLRAEGGSTWTDSFSELPATLRYFAGGDHSVRGFAFEELGPRDASGEVIGGRHLIAASVETEYRIRGDWGAAAFIDTGNAFNEFGTGLETGAGVGLRWRSPVGMVRVDLASAVSQDRGLRLHFTLGPDL